MNFIQMHMASSKLQPFQGLNNLVSNTVTTTVRLR